MAKRDPYERAIIYVTDSDESFYDLDGDVDKVVKRLLEMKKEREDANPDRVEPVKMSVSAEEEYYPYGGGSSVVGRLHFTVRRPENDEEYAHRLNGLREREEAQRIRDEEEFARLKEKFGK